MILALLLAPAHAEDGLQAQVFPGGIADMTSLFEGTAYDIVKADVGGAYDCWDYVGVRNFNLHVPVRTIDVDTSADGLTLTLAFDQIHGEDMEVYSTDTEWTDTCIEFDGTVKYLHLDNAVLTATIRPTITDGQLGFEVVGTPTLSGDLDSDVAWFPDDLVLTFFEQTILDTVAESIGEYAPALLEEALTGPLFEGSYADFDYALTMTGAETSDQGVRASASVDVGWSGDDGCPGGEGDPQGRDPRLDFGDGDGSTFALGLTEGELDRALVSLWEDGYFCFTRDNVAQFLSTVQSLFDPSVANLSAVAGLSEAPVVTIDESGIGVFLHGFSIEVDGTLDGVETQVLGMSGDIDARGEVRLDQDVAAFTLTLTQLDLSFDTFDAAHLVTDNPGAEDDLRRFLEGWVTDWAEQSVAELPLYPSLLHLADWYLKVDQLDYVEGGLILDVTVYAAGDPAIDTTPPDTTATAEKLGDDGVRLTWSGTDDRPGDLAYAWSLDASGWSGWTTDGSVDVTGLDPGTHIARVKARDAWWNEDASWAELTFDLEALPEATEAEKEGCGCATGGGAGGPGAWLGLVGLAWLSRRR